MTKILEAINAWTNRYLREARMTPGLLALLPIGLVAVALGAREQPILSSLFALVVAAGGPAALMEEVRKRGNTAGERVFSVLPSTSYLRHRGPASMQVDRDQWRGDVENATGMTLPTRGEEETDRKGADRRYSLAVDRLRIMVQGNEKLSRVADENRSYGYNRNLLGFKVVGLTVSLSASITLAGFGLVAAVTDLPIRVHNPEYWLCLSGTLALAVFWWRSPTVHSVKQAGERYARQLLSSAAFVRHDAPDQEPSTGA